MKRSESPQGYLPSDEDDIDCIPRTVPVPARSSPRPRRTVKKSAQSIQTPSASPRHHQHRQDSLSLARPAPPPARSSHPTTTTKRRRTSGLVFKNDTDDGKPSPRRDRAERRSIEKLAIQPRNDIDNDDNDDGRPDRGSKRRIRQPQKPVEQTRQVKPREGARLRRRNESRGNRNPDETHEEEEEEEDDLAITTIPKPVRRQKNARAREEEEEEEQRRQEAIRRQEREALAREAQASTARQPRIGYKDDRVLENWREEGQRFRMATEGNRQEEDEVVLVKNEVLSDADESVIIKNEVVNRGESVLREDETAARNEVDQYYPSRRGRLARQPAAREPSSPPRREPSPTPIPSDDEEDDSASDSPPSLEAVFSTLRPERLSRLVPHFRRIGFETAQDLWQLLERNTESGERLRQSMWDRVGELEMEHGNEFTLLERDSLVVELIDCRRRWYT